MPFGSGTFTAAGRFLAVVCPGVGRRGPEGRGRPGTGEPGRRPHGPADLTTLTSRLASWHKTPILGIAGNDGLAAAAAIIRAMNRGSGHQTQPRPTRPGVGRTEKVPDLGFPTKNAWQAKYGGDPGFGSVPNGGVAPVGWGNGDCWVTKFRPAAPGVRERT